MKGIRLLCIACLLSFAVFGEGQIFEMSAQEPALPILAIDFFGYGGIDLNEIRAHLPVHVGQTFSSYAEERSHSPEIRAAILQLIGKPVTSLSNVEIEDGYLIYIGLPGTTLQKFPTGPIPTSAIRLPNDAIALYERQMGLLPKAIAAGATEDDSKGYALSNFPDLRRAELDTRAFVLKNEPLVREVLTTSSDQESRAAAANLLGYADFSSLQIQSLVKACHDPDSVVRNNAVRAIGVIAEARPDLRSQIPPSPFIQMLRSDSWTDRNKAGWVLDSLTKSRDPKLLSELRSQILDPLIEMAQWHDSGHAGSFRLILGRIGRIDEVSLEQKAKETNQVDSIIAAAKKAG